MADLVFLGTPAEAVPTLDALLAAGHRVRAVVTRPDRRRGRGGAAGPSPVKVAAEAHDLPVLHGLGALADVGAELGVVVAYGRIVPADLLERLPMVNVHFSLLPRWRGAAPVERAVLAGDPVTGVSLMALEAGLDTGPVYRRAEVPIAPTDTAPALRARLATLGASLAVELLAGGVAGMGEPEPQVGEATYAEKLEPGELRLDFGQPADHLARVVRVGGAWTTLHGRRLRVLEASVVDPSPAEDGMDGGGLETGELVGPPGARLVPGSLVGAAVQTAEGALVLERVQPESRQPMAAADWLRGARVVTGDRLGT